MCVLIFTDQQLSCRFALQILILIIKDSGYIITTFTCFIISIKKILLLIRFKLICFTSTTCYAEHGKVHLQELQLTVQVRAFGVVICFT